MSDPLALVVEDEFDLSIIFAAAVEQAGFETEVIRSGDRALERLSVTIPRLVILDLHLPGASGVEILECIRADPRLADTRVIVATADAHLANVVKHQADRVLVKPVVFARLRDLASSYGSGALAGRA